MVGGPHGKVDHCGDRGHMWRAIRRGRATDITGAGVIRITEVRRDAVPVNVQAYAVVNILQMAPQPMSVSPFLAPAADAEVRMGAKVEDEPAAGQEVGCGDGDRGDWRGRDAPLLRGQRTCGGYGKQQRRDYKHGCSK